MNPTDPAVVTIFMGIFAEALPLLLAEVLVSSEIRLYVTPERVRRVLPQHPLGAALAGATLGLVFPVCECGAVRPAMWSPAAWPTAPASRRSRPRPHPPRVVTCCVADSACTGLPVVWRGRAALRNDSWVSVTGRIGLARVNGVRQPAIFASVVTPIAQPANPYLSP